MRPGRAGSPFASARPDRSLALVSLAMGASFVSQTTLALAVPLYALQLGASVASIGVLVSVPFWLPTILAIPIGRLVSRAGPRRVMLAGSVGFTLAPWLTVAFPGFAGLIATQLLVGLSQICMGVAAESTVAAVGQRGSLEAAFGWFQRRGFGGVAGACLFDMCFNRADVGAHLDQWRFGPKDRFARRSRQA